MTKVHPTLENLTHFQAWKGGPGVMTLSFESTKERTWNTYMKVLITVLFSNLGKSVTSSETGPAKETTDSGAQISYIFKDLLL